MLTKQVFETTSLFVGFLFRTMRKKCRSLRGRVRVHSQRDPCFQRLAFVTCWHGSYRSFAIFNHLMEVKKKTKIISISKCPNLNKNHTWRIFKNIKPRQTGRFSSFRVLPFLVSSSIPQELERWCCRPYHLAVELSSIAIRELHSLPLTSCPTQIHY